MLLCCELLFIFYAKLRFTKIEISDKIDRENQENSEKIRGILKEFGNKNSV